MIAFTILDAFLSCWNQFFRDNSDSDDQFGSKKLIKSQFDHNLSQFFMLAPLPGFSFFLFIHYVISHTVCRLQWLLNKPSSPLFSLPPWGPQKPLDLLLYYNVDKPTIWLELVADSATRNCFSGIDS